MPAQGTERFAFAVEYNELSKPEAVFFPSLRVDGELRVRDRLQPAGGGHTPKQRFSVVTRA
jgi:hypothetical protein